MAVSSTISSKGQVTVPVEVRKRLGLHQGDKVKFVFEGGMTVLKPVRAEGNPFDRFVGAAPGFRSSEEIKDWVADLRDEKD